MSGRIFPVYLDEERHVRFDNTALRLLDRELTKHYGHSFAHYVQRWGEEMGQDFYEDMDLGAINFDVMGLALKYGLRHDMPGIQDTQVDAMLDDADQPVAEVWGVVIEAWLEGSPLGLEETEEPEAGKEGSSGGAKSSDPYSDGAKATTPATSAPTSTD